MAEKPRLIIAGRLKGETICYRCSVCDQPFLLPEDRTPKEGALELWVTFKKHVEEEHAAEDAQSTKGGGDAGGERT